MTMQQAITEEYYVIIAILALGHLHDDPNIIIKLLNYITSKRSG